jgi:fucose permease
VPRLTRTLGVLASLAFVALGLPDALLGVAWPTMRRSFELPLDAVGTLLASYTVGYVCSSFTGGRLVARLGLGRLLVASCLATGCSLLAYTVVPSWGLVVCVGAVAGLGAGGIDAGINTYAASHHGPRMLNWLHACYGLGATAGPAIMTAVFAAGATWHTGYQAAAAAQLGLAAAFLATVAVWPPRGAREADGRHAAARLGETLRLPAARLGLVLFLVYTGLELSVGTWAFTLLTEGRALTPMAAGSVVGLYWAGLTAGRLGRALLPHAGDTAALLRGAILLLVFALTLLAAGIGPGVDAAALALAGVAAGPIFPSLIGVTGSRVGARHLDNTIGLQVAAAAAGQSLLPTSIGIATDALGFVALGSTLVGASVLVFAVNETAARDAIGR